MFFQVFYNIGDCAKRNDVYCKIASLVSRPQAGLLSKSFLYRFLKTKSQNEVLP
jgi:hypothetical protein